jgi:hypothetical protein
LWAKVFLGIGVVSIAASGLLLWLIKEHKIALPNNMDTSWLPVESKKSQISPEDDAKFADYMRKSISKIESANTATTPTSTVPRRGEIDPAAIGTPQQSTPVGSPAPISPGAATPSPAAVDALKMKSNISLMQTLQTGDRIGATFQIDGRTETVNVGSKIGKTGWSILSVAEDSIVVVKAGRGNRSIAIGQKL